MLRAHGVDLPYVLASAIGVHAKGPELQRFGVLARSVTSLTMLHVWWSSPPDGQGFSSPNSFKGQRLEVPDICRKF